jgi:cobalamin biosynthesis protein CobD/CbiB
METLTIRFVSLWLVPILLFIFLNGIWAFGYRALIEAYFIWLPQRQGFQYFGTAVSKIKNLVELIPTMIFAPIFSVFRSSPGWLSLVNSEKTQWQQSKASPYINLIWLSIVAAGCKSELAGPLMLDGKKLSRPRLNQGAAVSHKNVLQLTSWVNSFRLTFVAFNTIIIVLLAIIHS